VKQSPTDPGSLAARLRASADAISQLPTRVISRWGVELATRLTHDGRLLVAGNGGSAAQAQHLATELVGRYRHDRKAFSALALTNDVCSITAIGNDYGFESVFSRQVEAHGRSSDILLCLSTSGSSPNLIAAANVGRSRGLATWSLTGPAPNPLHTISDEALAIESPVAAVIQEAHEVALHLLCEAFEAAFVDSCRSISGPR